MSISPITVSCSIIIFKIPLVSNAGDTVATIYDLNGKILLSKTIISSEKFNYNLPSGVYIVRIKNKVSVTTKKLIVN